jgi:hypothetical protein
VMAHLRHRRPPAGTGPPVGMPDRETDVVQGGHG